jgi:elongation factor 1-alpha
MIIGASLADTAILIIDATRSPEGWSDVEDRAGITFTLGMKQIIVGVNKMDLVDFSEDVYTTLRDKVGCILKRTGYRPAKVQFIPLSGWLGDNLMTNSCDNMPWYEGASLFEAMDGFHPPKRPAEKPLRFSVYDSIKVGGVGTVVTGRVQTGKLCVGRRFINAVTGMEFETMSIEKLHRFTSPASPGDLVGFAPMRGLGREEFKRGDVISYIGESSYEEAKLCISFDAQVIILKTPYTNNDDTTNNTANRKMSAGCQHTMHCHSASAPVILDTIIEKLHRHDSAKETDPPQSLNSGDSALVTFRPTTPLVVEEWNLYHELGRFILRNGRDIVAVGIIKKVYRRERQDGNIRQEEARLRRLRQQRQRRQQEQDWQEPPQPKKAKKKAQQLGKAARKAT